MKTELSMKTEPLSKTNPYLQDTATMRKLIARSVRTSCGVEGIKAAPKIPFEFKERKTKKIYQTKDSD